MKVFVTGGGGFLGKAIVRQLIARGDEVRSMARSAYPELEAMGVETVRGDLGDRQSVKDAAEGCDAVIHIAARVGMWGPEEEFYRTNVTGTRNVLNACFDHGIRRMVYTSSPSVVFDERSMEGADESVPYPKHYLADYPRTKAEAEQLVLAANGPELATTSLRPHLIWGPEDNHLVPRIVARAKAGKLKFVGDGTNLVDTTYVDDGARAHLLALDVLGPGSANAGKAYFISQGQPVPLKDLVNRILAEAGLPPVNSHVPAPLAYAVGWAMEKVYGALGKTDEPLMTRFLAKELSTSHYFDISAAARDFGFTPTVTIDEGLVELGHWLRKPTDT
jgi:2-alkyl-3-oxoalkanoate reductase